MKGWCKFFAVQFLSASIMTPQLRREGKKVRQKVRDKEVADRLKVSRFTVYRWIKRAD